MMRVPMHTITLKQSEIGYQLDIGERTQHKVFILLSLMVVQVMPNTADLILVCYYRVLY